MTWSPAGDGVLHACYLQRRRRIYMSIIWSTIRTSMALTALACSAAMAAGVTDKEIVIGTHIDLSGPAAATTAPIRYGMQMRFDEQNEAGGVHGRKIRLVVEDNTGQPQAAVRAAQKLLRRDEVFAMVNTFGTATNAAVSKMTTDAGVLVFAPWADAGTMRSSSGNSPLMFTTTQDYDTTTSFAVSWAIRNWNVKKIGVIYVEGPMGEKTRHGVKAGLVGDAQVVAEAGFKPGDLDFSSQVARMRAADVDLLMVAGILREPVGISAEVKKLGWNNVRIMTGLPGQSVSVPRVGKEPVEGLYSVSAWVPMDSSAPDLNPVVRDRMEQYRRRFNQAPDDMMLPYAYADWFVKALAAAGRDLTTERVAAELKQMTFNDMAFWGPSRMDRDNHLRPESIRITQIQKGRWVPVSPVLTAVTR
jgi:ABC-type branched-subunit amino acid transport system substrate-binding protein